MHDSKRSAICGLSGNVACWTSDGFFICGARYQKVQEQLPKEVIPAELPGDLSMLLQVRTSCCSDIFIEGKGQLLWAGGWPLGRGGDGTTCMQALQWEPCMHVVPGQQVLILGCGPESPHLGEPFVYGGCSEAGYA